ncbi:MAG TPA: HemK/PrmC family methyltransferase [Candidatus Paceibacterota bacterium]
MSIPPEEALIRRDKYDGDPAADLSEDLARLRAGEPLAYVIGWIPFLGLRVGLSSRPLIPRPETEWWTEELIAHLKEKFGTKPFSFLDLCAGSGAIGLAVLAAFPQARVTLAELRPEHGAQIRENLEVNVLDASRATIIESDLFAALSSMRFDVIATNPPYIPEDRALEASVAAFEPQEALFAGSDGLSLIRRIAADAPVHLTAPGELWMECDTSNTEEAAALLRAQGATDAQIRTDPYGRPRIVVGYYA